MADKIGILYTALNFPTAVLFSPTETEPYMSHSEYPH